MGRRTVNAEPGGGDADTFLEPFRDDFVSAAQDLMRRNFGANAPEDLIEWVVGFGERARPDIALEILLNAKANDPALAAVLQRVSVPIVVINGDHRTIDTDSLARHGVQTVSMSGVGHFAMLEDPVRFNNVLAETIEEFVSLR